MESNGMESSGVESIGVESMIKMETINVQKN